MKKYSYLDMIHTLLPENEFLAFTEWYRKPLQKSIHLRYGKEQLEKEGWIFTPPDFSRAGKRYDDVLFVAKADKQSLGSHPLHQAGAFYVQEMAAGLPAQMLNVQP
jgi:16S rRNA C967 or C1407 C5-methylase (RsmB/RsmF family)